MNNNFFTWLPPTHPVMRAQNKPSARPTKEGAPWCFVDWYTVSCDHWWVLPPVSNTGGKSGGISEARETPAQKTSVDTLSLTFKYWGLWATPGVSFPTPEAERDGNPMFEPSASDVAVFASWLLAGTGVSVRKDSVVLRGQNNYESAIPLEDVNGVLVGRLQWGGEHQGKTIQVYLSGAACICINESSGFPLLYTRLTSYRDGACRITRLDICFDDYDGEYSIDRISQMYDESAFVKMGRPPKSTMFGNWKDGCERTFAVGRRDGAKYWRSYEKGHQLGKENSPWVRHEVEFSRCKGWEPPFEFLIDTDSAFAWSYKFCSDMIGGAEPACVVRQNAEKGKVSIEATVSTLKVQYGRWVKFLRNSCNMSPERIVNSIMSDDDELPNKLRQLSVGQFGHVLRNSIAEHNALTA